jgi:hypothetical protein
MFTKTVIALVLIVGSASGALAQKKSTNPAHDVYDTRGWYLGSDPDATVRAMIAHDRGSD